MKNITTVHTGNKTFYILQNEDGWYLAVDSKYVDENGKLDTKLNGCQMHASRFVKCTIQGAMMSARVEEYMEEGYSLEDALVKANNELAS